MITKNAQLCMDELAEHDLKYRLYDEDADGSTVLELLFSGTNGGPFIRMLLVFDAMDTTISLRCSTYTTFPPDVTDDVIAFCDENNHRYRFGKFYVDPEDNEVMMEVDSFVDSSDVTDVMHQCIGLAHDVLSETYPQLMRIIWARK